MGSVTYPILRVEATAISSEEPLGAFAAFKGRPAPREFLQAFHRDEQLGDASEDMPVSGTPHSVSFSAEVRGPSSSALPGSHARPAEAGRGLAQACLAAGAPLCFEPSGRFRSAGARSTEERHGPLQHADPGRRQGVPHCGGRPDEQWVGAGSGGTARWVRTADAAVRLRRGTALTCGPPGRGRERQSSYRSGPEWARHAAGRDAPPWQQAPLDPSMALQMQIQYEIMHQMRALGASAASRDDAPDADALDGLRVSRSLGRMRSLRETMEQNPERTYREYKDQWVRELGAEGRAFRWTDRNKSIRWGKFNSVRRCDWMLCHILETLERGDGALAKAQTVQCLKSLHDISNNGEWKTSWPLTHMVDPLRAHAHGGTEVEMEAVLGWVKTQDDLRRKVLTGGRA